MKTYKINWIGNSFADLVSCIEFVKKVSVEAAEELYNDVFRVVDSLATFPERNQTFPMPKSFALTVRKQVVKNRYLILYIVNEDNVDILSIIDVRRKNNIIM